MKIIKNIPVGGDHKLPILTDLFFLENSQPKPVVIFCHGYKGFKDWGPWNLIASHFAQQGFFFLKFNFSHNGLTSENLLDFTDLEAFGNNNFIKELDDLQSVINWISSSREFKNEADIRHISLIGHSRGGGIAVLKASEEPRVKKVISWAGVSDFGVRFPGGEILSDWRNKGIVYITNTRTNQQLPHYYQFYTTFMENADRLSIRKAVERLEIPYLIVQGEKDENVILKEALNLHSWNKNSELFTVPDAGHTFNCSHPYELDHFISELEPVIKVSLSFLNKPKG
ncbi:MAG TPA: alpha/beta hydrolase [Draconibacterium sp.]|nr:alpha/beta hydrolase [Draconibacterium sp.]